MTNSERIEAYFNNELSDAERQQLLHDVDTDASLKSEFQFQQDVIEGIKAYRKQELIARLDQIHIMSAGQAMLIKAVSVVGVIAVASLGTYLWMNNSSEQEVSTEQINNTEQVASESKDQPSATVITTVDDTEDKIVEDTEEATTSKVTKEPETKVNQTPAPSTPEVMMPNVLEPTDQGAEAITEDEIEAPEALRSSEIKLSTNTNVEVKFSKKYNFHYQIKQGRLTLFGDFGDTPFEVIELKTNKGLNSYLYYENNFYCLKTDSEKIRPLVAIDDAELIAELKKRR